MIGQVIDEPLQTSSHKPQPQKLNQTKKLQQKLAFNGLENREYLKNTCIRKGKKKTILAVRRCNRTTRTPLEHGRKDGGGIKNLAPCCSGSGSTTLVPSPLNQSD